MREQKYKAWEKEKKRWVKCSYPLTSGIEYETTIIGIQGDEDEDLIMPDDVEMVWYTGLNDKNGIEGYHKDIAEGFGRWLIEWDEAEGGFYLKSLIGYDKFPLRKLKGMKIVGNSMEHPELIEIPER